MYEGIPLKYFMWPHQHSTLDNIQEYAEDLFREILPKVKPNVFLLGILREELENRHPICIQPEDCGIDVALFEGIDDLAKSIHEKDLRNNIFNFMPYIQENHEYDVKKDSVRFAVQRLVNQNFHGKKKVSFVSRSVELENYEIFIIFQLDEDIYNSFHDLSGKDNYFRNSLLDSLIRTFLHESLDTIYRPRAANSPQSINTDKKEILRIAASDFVSSVIYAVCKKPGSWEFLNTCNYVSSLKYEGASSIGRLIVCKEDHPNLDILLKLSTPVRLNEYRKVRKLLEIASRDLSLYTNGQEILGFGKIIGKYDEKNQDLIEVSFSGHYKWELIHGNHRMLIVEHTNPSLPKQKINKEVFDGILRRIFENISFEDLENLWNIVDDAIKQKHGTLLIISHEAEKESNRLENQSTRIEPTRLNESLIRNVTSIDGAILLDSKGICYSIGVILDGKATDKGRSDRGARYNSAVRYVVNNKKKCVSIIISEDGMVDLYPILLPKIKKNEIGKHLEELKAIADEEILDDDRYGSVMRWFSQHEFYLSQENCNEINMIKMKCNEKERRDPYRLFVLWNDLKPNPDMDESYFLDDS
jgi:hypothetical protein